MTDVVTRVVMRAGEIFMVTAICPCCCKSQMLREVSPDCHQQLSLPPSTPHVTQQQQQQWLYSNIHNNINDSRDCRLYNNIGTHVHSISCGQWALMSWPSVKINDGTHLCMCLSIILSLSSDSERFNNCKLIKVVLFMFLQTFLLLTFSCPEQNPVPAHVATTQGWGAWCVHGGSEYYVLCELHIYISRIQGYMISYPKLAA